MSKREKATQWAFSHRINQKNNAHKVRKSFEFEPLPVSITVFDERLKKCNEVTSRG
jgi:hypothetical protein